MCYLSVPDIRPLCWETPPAGVPGDNQRIDQTDNDALGSVYLPATALQDAEIDGAEQFFIFFLIVVFFSATFSP